VSRTRGGGRGTGPDGWGRGSLVQGADDKLGQTLWNYPNQ
jgi:hypothetical protein